MPSLQALARVGGALLCVATVSAAVAVLRMQTNKRNAEKQSHAEHGTALMAVMRGLMDNRRLLVVPPDHWLMATLCKAKRLEHAATLRKEQNANAGCSCEELKTNCLKALLSDLKHELLSAKEDVDALSERVAVLASTFSELLPQYESLLVEVAVVHCLHEWNRSQREHDVEAFESFLITELQSQQASTWFNCQIVIDTVHLLLLSRLFYKERIHNPALRNAISMSVLRSIGDVGAFTKTLVACFSMEEFAATANAWAAWLELELEAMARSQVASTGSTGLGELMANGTRFDTDKHVYFPQGMLMKGVSGQSFGDLSGTLRTTTGESDALFPGFFYFSGSEPATVTPSIK